MTRRFLDWLWTKTHHGLPTQRDIDRRIAQWRAITGRDITDQVDQ